MADPVHRAEADFPQVPGVDAANSPTAGQRCHRTGAGPCPCVSRAVPQGHNISLLDVLTNEIRDATSHRCCLLVLKLNGYYM